MSSLAALLPPPGPDGTPEPDDVLTAFLGWVRDSGITPYPAQEEALLELATGSHVVLSTPTGSGKSLVATGAHFAALAAGRRSVYTAPIKALVSEKFFALVSQFGAANVGMVTGDASVNADAPIIACTAEILANRALREGAAADVGLVVMDEFHYYGDPARGWAWQVPLLELHGAQFLLMSATLGDTTDLREDLTRRTGRPTSVVASGDRPVPLTFDYALTPLHETVVGLVETHQSPVYVVHPTQAGAVEQASALMNGAVPKRADKAAIAAALGGFRFSTGFGTTLSRLVRAGIGVHHAGMLPRYRRLVETLAQQGLLTVICGTDTLGVGINVPIRTVLVSSLTKYDGTRVRHLSAREFHQVAGRAGRAGYDTSGYVVVQAPEHEVENARRVAKAGDDPKKLKNVQRVKPTQGEVSWTEATFTRLVNAEPERLQSRMRVSTTMLLDVMARPGDPVAAMRALLTDNHESPQVQRRLVRRALALARSLRAAGVVERLPAPLPDGRSLALTVDLPRQFALNQPLSTFALAALELLDRDDPGYVLDVLSVLESTLDDPRQVLMAQQNAARGEAVAQMKADGIEYEERMERLAEITWPRPLAEMLEPAYETYGRGHPWITDHPLSPKSVAREMAERAMTFTEYVSAYGLSRSEGLVLRYLADAAKALARTVPEEARTEEMTDLTAWLAETVRQTDSSLLDEWERLIDPAAVEAGLAVGPAPEAAPPPVTRNVRAFRVLVRNAMFRRVQLAALRRWYDLGELDGADGWDRDAWQAALEPYFDEHDEIGTGPGARGPKLFQLEVEGRTWKVRQVLADPAEHHDWFLAAEVDLDASDEAGEAVLRLTSIGRIGTW